VLEWNDLGPEATAMRRRALNLIAARSPANSVVYNELFAEIQSLDARQMVGLVDSLVLIAREAVSGWSTALNELDDHTGSDLDLMKSLEDAIEETYGHGSGTDAA